jgi:signal transduction histidine kinase
LGLSITVRIVEEHGGTLELRSREGDGATFVITLPYREKES